MMKWGCEVDRDLKISDVVIGIITCRFQRHSPSSWLRSANQRPWLPWVTNQKPVHPLQNRHLHLSIPRQPPPTHNWMLTRTLHSRPLIGCFWQPDLLIGLILLLIWAPPGGALFQSSISSVHKGHKTLQTPPRICVPSLTCKSRNPSSTWNAEHNYNKINNPIPQKSLFKCQDFCKHLTDWTWVLCFSRLNIVPHPAPAPSLCLLCLVSTALGHATSHLYLAHHQ